jgi:hypothetical protein
VWASPGTSTLAAKNTVVLSKNASSNNLKSAHLRYKGPIQAAKAIWAHEGYRGFFRGAQQRMAVMAPGFAISWTAYESAKALLLGEFSESM